MPTRNDALKDRLSRSREINITVTGRKSGRSISIPVWFVLEGDTLYLLWSRGRIHNGTRTCLRTRRFGSKQAGQKLKFVPFLSRTPHR